jgi:acyl carrier protein
MQDVSALKQQIKAMLVEHLMLKLNPADIADAQPLFGPDGLGLDSVDALQLVVALEKNFRLKIPDPATAREVLRNVDTITLAVQRAGAAS